MSEHQYAAGPDKRALRRAFQLVVGLLTVVLGGLILRYELAPDSTWRPLLFDAYQRAFPRDTRTAQVAVVAIDETTLNEYGRWPWPRGQLGELLAAIGQLQPKAIGLDITLREADDHERWLNSLYNATEKLVADIRALPTQDEVLAHYLRQLPVVLSRQGTDLERDLTADVPDWPVQVDGDSRPRALLQFPARLTNLPALEHLASGLGYTNAAVGKDAVVRRVPVVLEVGGALVPSFALELIRVATGANWVSLTTRRGAAVEVAAGGLAMPVDGDGQILLRYAPYQPQAWIPAHALLSGDADATARATDADIIIVGVTALDLTDAVTTPVWGSAIGVDVHLQTLENLLLDARIVRPDWAPWAEYLYVALLLIAAATMMGRLSGLQAIAGLGLALLIPGVASVTLFTTASIQLDPSWPTLSVLVLGVSGVLTQLRATRQHAARVSAFLARERTERARLSGELDAAREIQMGMLPAPEAVVGLPPNIDLHAALRPAREVGGDLYDMFMLDEHRLFFVVGDVAGKGVPASLFMALGKTLCKSNALRGQLGLEELVCVANEEISRDNPGMMFITAMFGLLDTRTGELEFCNAGHDPPFVVHTDGSTGTLEGGGGPPLCVVDDFPYMSETATLQPGDTVVVVTDGITEAQNEGEALFGRERLVETLAAHAGQSPAALVDAMVSGVDAFAGTAEQFDDLTVFAVRFAAPDQAAT